MGYVPRRLRGSRKRPPSRPAAVALDIKTYKTLGEIQKSKAIPLEPPMTETVKRPASGSWRSLWR